MKELPGQKKKKSGWELGLASGGMEPGVGDKTKSSWLDSRPQESGVRG